MQTNKPPSNRPVCYRDPTRARLTLHCCQIATYIGLVALTVLGLTIALTLYYLVIRRPVQYRDLSAFSAPGTNRASYKVASTFLLCNSMVKCGFLLSGGRLKFIY